MIDTLFKQSGGKKVRGIYNFGWLAKAIDFPRKKWVRSGDSGLWAYSGEELGSSSDKCLGESNIPDNIF